MIARVYKFHTGAVMSFDPSGDLIQRFTGQADDLHDQILTAATPDAQFFSVDPNHKKTPITGEEF
jgi:hypothetical protein